MEINKSYIAAIFSVVLVGYSVFVLEQKLCGYERFMSYLPGLGTTHTYDPETETNPKKYIEDQNELDEKTEVGDVVPTESNNLQEVRGKNIRWQMPSDSKKLIITLQESNGTFIREFVITDYFTIKPGQKVQLRAE